MDQQKIGRMFRGRNFITPVVITFGETDEHVYELSKETETPSMLGLHGVTVLTKQGKTTDLNKCCNSYAEAVEYIQTLK